MEKIMLITGGSRGIGAATALRAARQGYNVAITYRDNTTAANNVVALLRATGRTALAVQADVAVEADVLRAFTAVDEQLGPISCLVNNAGIVDLPSRVDAMTVERLQRMFTTNITSAFVCAREAVRRMSTLHGGQGGAIVNISSAAARLGSPGQYVDYAASKGAIDTFTIGLAKEVATEGIRVNAVRPGLIYTDIHASGGLPDRVDQLKSAVPMQRGL
jgi:NAD(P)-dependent dehydrogenase (short-subunit alcohol dehydrogenase family)